MSTIPGALFCRKPADADILHERSRCDGGSRRYEDGMDFVAVATTNTDRLYSFRARRKTTLGSGAVPSFISSNIFLCMIVGNTSENWKPLCRHLYSIHHQRKLRKNTMTTATMTLGAKDLAKVRAIAEAM
jgi:hypothetical protein